MGFAEAIRVALQSLWANKLRTILTVVGVVIGVASVIAVITLANGAKMFVVQKIATHGSDTLTVTRMNPVIFTGEEFLRENKRKDITFDDYEYLQRTCTRCLMLAAELSSSGKVVNGKQSTTNTTINGWTANMAEIADLNIVQGRALTPMDDDMGTHGVVVGYDIVDNLLPNVDPIGQDIRVDGEVYSVVGVGERKGEVFGQSEDNYVDMPLSTYLHTHGAVSYTHLPIYGPPRAGDIQDSLADISAAREAIGYEPKIGFEEGLRRTVAWYREEYASARV